MTDKEKKSKIADILLEFYDEYQCNMPNRPMIPSLYASKIIDSLQGEPVSEELEAELDKYIKDNFTIDREQLNRFGIEEKDYMYSMDKSDMLKMLRYFTNNYKVPASNDLEEAAKLCVSDSLCITNEEDWDDAAVDALNIFKTGAKWQKEQMMASGVDGVVHHLEKCKVASVHYNDPTGVPMAYFTSPEGLSAGDKVKIIVIKEAKI